MSALINNLLVLQEGVKTKPYLDCCGKYWRECQCEAKGKLTIGVGRNLDDMGITTFEAEYLLNNDIKRVSREADQELSWFSHLDWRRQDAVLSMIFNMGVTRFREFKNMISALSVGDFERASQEMLDSTWAKEVPARAECLAEMVRKGAPQ